MLNRNQVLDHTVHRPCEEGINIAVRISDVLRCPQGVELVSSSKYPGYWPWSITVKATTFANTLAVQIGRARRNDGSGNYAARTGWRRALWIPGPGQQQPGQAQGHVPNHHSPNLHQHPTDIHAIGNDHSDNDDDDGDHVDVAFDERLNIPALLQAIRHGDLRLPFDQDRFRSVSIYSPIRQAEIVAQEYRKDASFQEITIQATDVKEHTFYHFQIWFSSAIRIPRLMSSTLSRLQQAMMRLRKDTATANVCIRLVDAEDDFGGQGAAGGPSGGIGGGEHGSGDVSNETTDGHGNDLNEEDGSGQGGCGDDVRTHSTDPCSPELSLVHSSRSPKRPITLGDNDRKRIDERKYAVEPMSNKKVRLTEVTTTTTTATTHGSSMGVEPAFSPLTKPTTSCCSSSSSLSAPNTKSHPYDALPRQSTCAGDRDHSLEGSQEEEVVVFAHKSILDGDPFFHRLLNGSFHEATADGQGMHTVTLSREIFPTKEVIDTVLDFVYAEVISVDMLQPLQDYMLPGGVSQEQQRQWTPTEEPSSHAANATATAIPARSSIASLDHATTNVFRCPHGHTAAEVAKSIKCPSSVLFQARRMTSVATTAATNVNGQGNDTCSYAHLYPTVTMCSDHNPSLSDNVPLGGGAIFYGQEHGKDPCQSPLKSTPLPTRCQEQLVCLTQLWDDLYGAAHFMQNDHLRRIALSQLQLDQHTTLARAMRRGCLFQEVEQAMYHYLIREQRPIFGIPQTNQLRPYFLVENPWQMAFLLNLTSSMARGGS